jgi:dsDNA-specific endonuclease/ATPase MutS2
MQIHKGIREDFPPMFQAKISQLIKDLDNVFRYIQHDVDQVCSTNDDDSPEGKKMREELLSMLPEARQFLHEEIQKTLRTCKNLKE